MDKERKELLNMMKEGSGKASEICRFLSNQNRLMILCALIHSKGMSSGELSQMIGLSHSATSQHLTKMRDAKLITAVRERQSIIYSLAEADLKDVITSLQKAYCPLYWIKDWPERLKLPSHQVQVN